MPESRAEVTHRSALISAASLLQVCRAVVTDHAARGDDASLLHVDRLIAAVADRQHALVTREQLSALGLGRGALRGRVERGLLYPLHRGVFIWGCPSPTPVASALGAVYACSDGAVLSHHAAAARWGIRPEHDGPIDVTVARGRRVRHPGIRVHETRWLAVGDVCILEAIPITSPARTLLDIASQLSTCELGRSVEQAQIKGLVTKRDLRAAIDRAPNQSGKPALLAVIEEPAFTRSEAERRLAALLRAAKLPRPAFNHTVERFEVDALWRVERVIVEFDGYAFHATRAAFERDRRKAAKLTRAGYFVLRTTWRELTEEPHALIARIAEVLALAGARARAA